MRDTRGHLGLVHSWVFSPMAGLGRSEFRTSTTLRSMCCCLAPLYTCVQPVWIWRGEPRLQGDSSGQRRCDASSVQRSEHHVRRILAAESWESDEGRSGAAIREGAQCEFGRCGVAVTRAGRSHVHHLQHEVSEDYDLKDLSALDMVLTPEEMARLDAL